MQQRVEDAREFGLRAVPVTRACSARGNRAVADGGGRGRVPRGRSRRAAQHGEEFVRAGVALGFGQVVAEAGLFVAFAGSGC